jgi:hypothetical protein
VQFNPFQNQIALSKPAFHLENMMIHRRDTENETKGDKLKQNKINHVFYGFQQMSRIRLSGWRQDSTPPDQLSSIIQPTII